MATRSGGIESNLTNEIRPSQLSLPSPSCQNEESVNATALNNQPDHDKSHQELHELALCRFSGGWVNPNLQPARIKVAQSQHALIRAEVLRLLYGGVPSSLLANALLAILLVFVQWPAISQNLASAWLVLFGSVLVARALMYLSYQRTKIASRSPKTNLLWRFRLGAIATGVVWGMHGFLLFPTEYLAHQVFLAFVLAGVGSGAITSLSADRTSALGFVIPAVSPLIPMLFMVGGTIPLTMGVMVLLFLVFVTASSSRLQQQLYENIRLRAEYASQAATLQQQQQINELIARAQSQFIRETHRRKAFDGLLSDMLSLTESEYGFIGEVLHTTKGKPYLKTYAISNIAWNDATRSFYQANAPQGMEFHNLETLFGAALTTGKPVIANYPATDPRRGGLPEGHPALDAFLGIPIHHGDELVAMIGLANRPGGYDQVLIEFMRPLLVILGQLVVAVRIQQQHRKGQQELSRFKNTLDRTLDCVFMFDADSFRFFYVNEGAMRQVGYSRDELLHMHPFDIRPDISEAQFHALIAPLLAGEQDSLTFETTHKHKYGQRIPVEIFLQYIATKDEPARFVAIVRDITERKRIERMKSEFVSTVSHELRTPLTSISGALGLLTGGALGTLSEGVRKLVDIAHQNSLRLTFLINDLLDMEKLLAGKMQFDMQVQSLMPPLEHSIRDIQSYAEQRMIRLNLIGITEEICVNVDLQRLQQIMANLLSNAAKFSPEGGVVEVTVSRGDTTARVEVKDSGPGIPAAFHEHIFQKFAQADASDTRQKGGTGLGLAITRELIERMGGTIDFDSVEGEGARFFFELPLHPVNQASPGLD